MDQLPAPKFQQRTWRYTRKRRRSGAEPNESEGLHCKNYYIKRHFIFIYIFLI